MQSFKGLRQQVTDCKTQASIAGTIGSIRTLYKKEGNNEGKILNLKAGKRVLQNWFTNSLYSVQKETTRKEQ